MRKKKIFIVWITNGLPFNESGLVSNHPSPSSAIIIPSSPEEFPEVEELYAISQGGRTICNEVGIALSTKPPKFHLPQPQ